MARQTGKLSPRFTQTPRRSAHPHPMCRSYGGCCPTFIIVYVCISLIHLYTRAPTPKTSLTSIVIIPRKSHRPATTDRSSDRDDDKQTD